MSGALTATIGVSIALPHTRFPGTCLPGGRVDSSTGVLPVALSEVRTAQIPELRNFGSIAMTAPQSNLA